MFTLFPNLPSELRVQIWKHALPSSDFGRIYTYKSYCWMEFVPTEEEEIEDLATDRSVDFVPDFVTQEIGMPLFFVCQEARQEALSWLKKHNFEMRYCIGKFPYQGGIFHFMRRMDENDILYIPTTTFSTLGDDHFEIWDDLEDGVHDVYTHFDVSSIAVPEDFFANDEEFPPPFASLFDFETLYVVTGEQPDEEDDGVWDLVPKGSGSVIWKANQGFAIKGGEGGEDEELLLKIVEDTKNLGDLLQTGSVFHKGDTVEILPALAVRKWTN